jgi:hypothetical protein
MAIRKIIETGSGFLPIPPDFYPGQLDTPDGLKAAIESTLAQLQDLTRAFNGLISLGDGTSSARLGNLNAQLVSVVFPGTPGNPVKIPHGLLRVPVGYAVVGQEAAGHVYDGDRTAWGDEHFFLKSDTANLVTQVAVW